MININLIIKRPSRLNWRRVGITVAAGAAVMGVTAYGLIWWQEYRQLKSDVAGLVPLEQTYNRALKQADKLKEQEETVAREAQRLGDIGRNQAPQGQAAVLQAVFGAASTDVFVTDVSIDRERGLLLSGEAPSFDAAIGYLRALQKLPGLTGVEERKLSTAVRGPTSFTFAAKVRREGAP